MTDEEMAEEYADTVKCEWENDTYWVDCRDKVTDAFLAGLKAGKDMNVAIKWHKVADGDLPKEPEFLKKSPDNHRYEWFLVATVGKPDEALYSFSKKKWFIDYEEMMLGDSCFKPIAWCEIPRYKEE